jgi:hypothetical protein
MAVAHPISTQAELLHPPHCEPGHCGSVACIRHSTRAYNGRQRRLPQDTTKGGHTEVTGRHQAVPLSVTANGIAPRSRRSIFTHSSDDTSSRTALVCPSFGPQGGTVHRRQHSRVPARTSPLLTGAATVRVLPAAMPLMALSTARQLRLRIGMARCCWKSRKRPLQH